MAMRQRRAAATPRCSTEGKRFLALRGLFGHAVQAGDGEAALGFPPRQRPAPERGWVFERLLALEIEAGRWEAARDTLADAARRHLLPERARRIAARHPLQLSLAAEAAGEWRRAAVAGGKRAAAAPDLAPAAARHARLLIAEDSAARRGAAIERAWRTRAAPGIGAALRRELGSGAPALELVTWFEKLAEHNPDCGGQPCRRRRGGAGRAALGRGAPPSRPGDSRRPAGRAVAPAVPADGAARRKRASATGAARDWLDRALAAPPDPRYACIACGAESGDGTRCARIAAASIRYRGACRPGAARGAGLALAARGRSAPGVPNRLAAPANEID